MQRSLVAFLNHGVLPFVGRDAELERICSFWNETTEAPGLRSLLLIGEAGIGKSRLVEESTRSIAASGGAVIHVKLYPDAATSLAPLLARALTRCAAAQQLLKSEPEENMTSVFSALARICGLRPTLFAVEDLHLLSGDALGEFASLLERLSDEPLSLLVCARPGNVPARSVIERYLVDEIELAGLRESEIADLCLSVFGEKIDRQIVGVLREKTLGNAMALRSALRAGLKSGASASTPKPRAANVRVDQRTFVDELERNVRLLSEGMAAHLTDREKMAARALAPLGEVFARETAAEMIENAEAMLEILSFKGIIHSSTSAPPPLPGQISAGAPLAFTHTLLHRHFIDQGEIDRAAIVRVLASELPLYSLLPFFLLLEQPIPASIPRTDLERAILRTTETTFALDSGPDWAYAMTVWKTAAALSATLDPHLVDDERREWETRLLIRKLALMRRDQTQDYPGLVARVLELTAEPDDDVRAERRMRALVYHRRHLRDTDLRRSLEVWDDVEALTQRFPSIRFSTPYVIHLRESSRIAQADGDVPHQRRIESHLETLLASDQADEELKRYAWEMIAPNLLTLFESHEELERRLSILAELESTTEGIQPELIMWKIGILYTTGRLREALETIDASIEVFIERGLARETLSCRLISIFARLLLGVDPELMAAQITEMYEATPKRLKPTLDAIIGSHFAGAGFLLNDLPWTERVLRSFPNGPGKLSDANAILLGIHFGDPDRLPTTINGAEPEQICLRELLRLYRDGDGEAVATVELVTRYLARRTLKLDELLVKLAILDLVAAMRDRGDQALTGSDLRAACRAATLEMSAWVEPHLPLVAARILDKYAGYLTRTELRAARARLESTMIENVAERIADRRTRISMLGTITVQAPGEETVRVRGAQLCVLLGLMAADRLLRDPLSASEFTAIAMGTERDPESVRKSLNFAVFRLRELIGSDAISTDGETPALNFDLVHVDIIEAQEHLRAAAEAMRDGALLRAVPELMAALEITRGEVPFPTLYDEFFEAAREDFESELRLTTIRIAKALAREGDHDAAERVLSRAFAAMPDDEELAELLQVSFVALGKRTEAKRVGMRITEES